MDCRRLTHWTASFWDRHPVMGCLSSFWPEHCTGLARPCYNTVKGGKQMETVYFDAPKDCIGIALSGKQVVYTGLEIHRSPSDTGAAKPWRLFSRRIFTFTLRMKNPKSRFTRFPRC